VLFRKQFNKVLKQAEWRPIANGQNTRYNISEQQHNVYNIETDDKENQSKGVQCHECEGYGHIRTECATFLKKRKKSLFVSWFNEDVPERSDDNDFTNQVNAMTGRVSSDTKSCDEELDYDELVASYKGLYVKSAEICKMLEEQKKINSQILAERSNHLAKISELNDEVRLLNSQFEHIKKQVKMMTTGASTLDEILEGQVKENPNGIGFDYNPLNQKQQNHNFAYTLEDHGMIRNEKQDIRVTVATGINTASTSKIMLQYSGTYHSSMNKKVTRPWICHHCNKKGHIRPFCFKLYGYPNQSGHKSRNPKKKHIKKNWIPKCNHVGLMVHTSLETSSSDVWYFDSGCSRHMAGENIFFENIKSRNDGCVVFGDGSKGRVQGMGNVGRNESPKLENVFLVKGLVSNLISISQLCGQGLEVKFNKIECLITNQEGEVLMRGIRSKNNYYKWVP